MTVYCDNDPGAAQWTRNLVGRGLVAPGEVLERSIADVEAEEVRNATQFHAFAGIAVWSHALRLAGWPDDCEVWTASCPCQPLSNAGRKKGFADERHLWPEFFRLVRECRPPVVVGEQVASPPGRAWLDLVQSDLEAAGYAFGAAVLPACSVGAPHQRERLYFVALADGERLEGVRVRLRERGPRPTVPQARGGGEAGGLADAERDGRGPGRDGGAPGRPTVEPDRLGDAGALADGGGAGREGRAPRPRGRGGPAADGDPGALAYLESARRREGDALGPRGGVGAPEDGGRARPTDDREVGVVGDAGGERGGRDAGAVPGAEGGGEGRRQGARRFVDVAVAAGPTRGHWYPCRWVVCRDGKARPVELPPLAVADGPARGVAGLLPAPEGSGREDAYDTFPLSFGEVGRTARLRGYGNAVVAQVAQAFIESVIDLLVVE